MKLENVLAREKPHIFVIYKYLISNNLKIIPLYFYRTGFSKKNFIDIFKLLEEKNFKSSIIQKKFTEKDLLHTKVNFLSFIQNEGAYVLCHVQCDSNGMINVTTGYKQHQRLSQEHAIRLLKPIKISFSSQPDNQEFIKFDDWHAAFRSDAECYRANHIFTEENALPANLCDQILNSIPQNKQRSQTLSKVGIPIESAIRTSSEAYLDNVNLMRKIQQISAQLLGDIESYILEKPLLVTYSAGQQYKPHFDTTDDYSLKRRRTVIIYLNDNFTGGETEFVVLGLKIQPRKGMALIFDNITSGQTSLFSMHAGLPVFSGYKHLCNVWTD